MPRRPALMLWSTVLLCLVALSGERPAAAQAGATAEPKMQVAPDEAAFRAANANVEATKRAAALQGFVHDYPKSRRAGRARRIVLELLISQQPRDERRIHQAAKALIDSADKDSRGNDENVVAYLLAEALPDGVDLKAAEVWARDAVDGVTLPKLTAQMRQSAAADKELVPSDAFIHEIFAVQRASSLQTLADVYLHEGKLADATATLNEAQTLSPTLGASFTTRGQVAHAQHHDDQALDALESAAVYGGMTFAATELMKSLYAAQHGGDGSGLEAEIDHRYRALFKPIAPAQHAASKSGRSVLLSLYTGSGCAPCAAADLAMDAVLQSYPRSQVVALAFDQHIPEPDPLANPATVARAAFDGIQYTPTFRLDGAEGPPVYGERSQEQEAYKTLAPALDKELEVPSGVTLHLAGKLTPAHTVTATAEFHVTDEKALHKLLASRRAGQASASQGSAASAPDSSTATTPAAKLVLNCALVQREVRYSGENGIRFHAMVVRDVAKAAAEGVPVAVSGSSSGSFTFDPAEVSRSLSKYLTAFAQHNDRFAAPHFLSTDTTLPLEELAVAAWVEDLTSHQVVAAAYSPLQGDASERAAR